METALKLTNSLITVFDIDEKDAEERCIYLVLDYHSKQCGHTRSIEYCLCNNYLNLHPYLTSNDRKPLLIIVQFSEKMDLYHLRIHALNKSRLYVWYAGGVDSQFISTPKVVKIYKVVEMDIAHTFIYEKMLLLTPDLCATFLQSSVDVTSGQKIDLSKDRFKSTKCIALYFENNQKPNTKTQLNAISFYGSTTKISAVPIVHVDFTTQQLNEEKKMDSQVNSNALLESDIVRRRLETNCPGEHDLHEFIALGHSCDACKKDIQYLQHAWGCRKCNYDLCYTCFNYSCNLTECIALKALLNNLQLYNIWMSTMNTLKKSQQPPLNGDDYNAVKILNHLNHLLFYHQNQFEEIYKILHANMNNNQICKLSNCLMMRRNHRNRNKIGNISLKNVYYGNDDMDIVTQQIMDRIHCHYAHTFDIGYRLTIAEKQSIINQEVKVSEHDENNIVPGFDMYVKQVKDIVNAKRNKHQNIKELVTLPNRHCKYSSIGDMYSFGFRYFYWKYYKDNHNEYDDAHVQTMRTAEKRPKANNGYNVGQFYVEKKYHDLKDELITNSICSIDVSQWNQLLIKGKMHSSTNHCKEMKCVRDTNSCKCYDMQLQAPITVQHIICLMVYCNYDVLQAKFSETFRCNEDEESIVSVINRHRNYYHLGKLLREAVECFGSVFCCNVINVYHGVDKTFRFPSTSAYIKGPFSTTTDFTVATNFCGNKGMILSVKFSLGSHKINGEVYKDIRNLACMDSMWVSDFINEQEILFIGGLNRLDFTGIIDVCKNMNYYVYIQGLRYMDGYATASMNSAGRDAPATLDKQMLFRLLSHQIWRQIPNHKNANEWKKLPSYFQDILNLHCINVQRIQFEEVNAAHPFEILFTKDDGWIDIELITTLFPNAKSIGFRADHVKTRFMENIKSHAIYVSVLSFLRTNSKSTQMKVIAIKINPFFKMEIMDHIQQYQRKFAKYGWALCVMGEEMLACGACIWMCTIESLKDEKRLSIFGNDTTYTNTGTVPTRTSNFDLNEYLMQHPRDAIIM